MSVIQITVLWLVKNLSPKLAINMIALSMQMPSGDGSF